MKQWIEPNLRKYCQMDWVRGAMAEIASEEKELSLQEMYELLVWPMEDAKIEFLDVLVGAVGLSHLSSKLKI
jgi:hypothetical protein